MPGAKKAHHEPAPIHAERLTRLLGYNLSRADLTLRKLFHRHMAPLQLRPVEFSVLVLIASNPKMNQKQLGAALEVSAPNLAVLLDRLTERGLIKRVRSNEDRRAQRLHLKAAGKTLVARAEKVAATMEGDALNLLSEGERTLLVELLQRLHEDVSRALDDRTA